MAFPIVDAAKKAFPNAKITESIAFDNLTLDEANELYRMFDDGGFKAEITFVKDNFGIRVTLYMC